MGKPAYFEGERGQETPLSLDWPAVDRPSRAESIDSDDDAFQCEVPSNDPLSGRRIYFHALRRRWRMAMIFGGTCAVLAAVITWNLQVPSYTAMALLRVGSTEEVLFNSAVRGTEDYETYKNTQRQLLKSDFVLDAAMQRPEINGAAALSGGRTSARALAGKLEVDFPGKAEIMQVWLSAADAHQAALIVNAVVDAYMDEVVNLKRNERSQHLRELERLNTDREAELRSKHVKLKSLVEQVGTGDSSALASQQQMVLQEFADLRRELLSLQSEGRRIRGQLKAKQAMLSGAAPLDLDALGKSLASDPVATRLMQQEEMSRVAAAMDRRNLAAGAEDHSVTRYEQHAQLLREQLEARQSALREDLSRQRRAEIESEAAQFQTQLAVIAEQEQELARSLEATRVRLRQLGGSSADVEMIRAEIDRLESVLKPIAEQRERLKVELRFSGGRALVLQRAEAPSVPDTGRRARLAAVTALLFFGIPLCGLVIWDARERRINSSEELASPLGLKVLGSMPLVPARTIDPSRPLPPGRLHWRVSLDQAVNSIAARVIREAKEEGSRALLISSASSGEGKTTLASELAKSLAREGYRTLLLDFDLRKPSLDRVFHLPLAPGVGNYLSNTGAWEDVRQTVAMNLSVITAGSTGPLSLRTLSSDRVGALLARGREEYEFVIVDASPILPVPDARLICQHIDAVILSVLRDVSRAPHVLAAAKALAAFGAKRIGAVMIGSSHEVY